MGIWDPGFITLGTHPNVSNRQKDKSSLSHPFLPSNITSLLFDNLPFAGFRALSLIIRYLNRLFVVG